MRYRIARAGNIKSDHFWVVADTQEEARRLIALNVAQAIDATDPAKFDCSPSEEYHVPVGVILSRTGAALAIKKR